MMKFTNSMLQVFGFEEDPAAISLVWKLAPATINPQA
jgi:hypothetical protein